MRRNGIGIPGRNRFCKINARIAADLLDRVIAQTEADFLGELEELFQRTTDIKLDPKRRAVRAVYPTGGVSSVPLVFQR